MPAVDSSHVTVVYKLPFDFVILWPPDGVKNSSTFVCTLTIRFDRDYIVRDDSRTRTPDTMPPRLRHAHARATSPLLFAPSAGCPFLGTPTGADCQFISGSTVS